MADDPGARVLEALRAVPGGPELLRVASAREDVALVGGAVRDLLSRHAPRELDVVLDGDATAFIDELVSRLSTPAPQDHGAGAPRLSLAARAVSSSVHERFGTAIVEWESGRIDIAERRAESYPAPGALPEVRPGSIEEDLARRDFTVNAIAVALGGPSAGEVVAVEHALEDLAAGRLRVLHEQSFIDDPTRLLRLARYRARLGFGIEQRTAELAAEAVGGGAVDTVSRARVGAELRLALAEPEPVAALSALAELGVLSALDRRLCFDADVARRAVELLPADGRPDLLLIASLLLALSVDRDEDPEPVMFDLLDDLEFTAGDRERVMRTALVAPALATEIGLADYPSDLHETLFAHTLEATALGGVLGAELSRDETIEMARDWLHSLREVKLTITGNDLIAAGLPEGPEIGRRLEAVLHQKLDGELDDSPEAELRAALEAPL
jgi:tRNA nucleotidyltransferase (CCA-adding enzyme)